MKDQPLDREALETAAKVVAALLLESRWRYTHSGREHMAYDNLMKAGARAKLEQMADREFAAYCERQYPLFQPTVNEQQIAMYRRMAEDPEVKEAAKHLGEAIIDEIGEDDDAPRP